MQYHAGHVDNLKLGTAKLTPFCLRRIQVEYIDVIVRFRTMRRPRNMTILLFIVAIALISASYIPTWPHAFREIARLSALYISVHHVQCQVIGTRFVCFATCFARFRSSVPPAVLCMQRLLENIVFYNTLS